MNIELFNNLVNNIKENKLIENFTKELSNYLNLQKEKENDILQENKTNINDFREENGLYQVVDRSLKGVYLQNMRTNQIFEETNISPEILDAIGNDYILRYKDGKYIIEQKLTDDFFNGMMDI